MATMQEFRARGMDMTSPGTDLVPIDLSSADHVPSVPYRAFVVKGTAGDVKIDTLDGTGRVVPSFQGEINPVIVTRVYKTGTTATSVFGYL